MSRFKKSLKHEAGISTIELVISAALGAVVAIGIFTIFVNVLSVSENTSTRTLATSTAQSVSSSLVATLRNSDTVTVSPKNEAGQQIVRARSASSEPGKWVCNAWVFGVNNDRGKAAIFQKSSAQAPVIPTTEEGWKDWGMLATEVTPALENGEYVSSSILAPVIFGYAVATGKGEPLVFSNKVMLNAAGPSSLNCG